MEGKYIFLVHLVHCLLSWTVKWACLVLRLNLLEGWWAVLIDIFLPSSPHLLALRPVSFILVPVFLLLIVWTAQQPDPLFTLLLSHRELVNIALHIPSSKQVRFHGSRLFPFTVCRDGRVGREKTNNERSRHKSGRKQESWQDIWKKMKGENIIVGHIKGSSWHCSTFLTLGKALSLPRTYEKPSKWWNKFL